VKPCGHFTEDRRVCKKEDIVLESNDLSTSVVLPCPLLQLSQASVQPKREQQRTESTPLVNPALHVQDIVGGTTCPRQVDSRAGKPRICISGQVGIGTSSCLQNMSTVDRAEGIGEVDRQDARVARHCSMCCDELVQGLATAGFSNPKLMREALELHHWGKDFGNGSKGDSSSNTAASQRS
jgi:hypothetical protein